MPWLNSPEHRCRMFPCSADFRMASTTPRWNGNEAILFVPLVARWWCPVYTRLLAWISNDLCDTQPVKKEQTRLYSHRQSCSAPFDFYLNSHPLNAVRWLPTPSECATMVVSYGIRATSHRPHDATTSTMAMSHFSVSTNDPATKLCCLVSMCCYGTIDRVTLCTNYAGNDTTPANWVDQMRHRTGSLPDGPRHTAPWPCRFGLAARSHWHQNRFSKSMQHLCWDFVVAPAENCKHQR